MFKLPKIHPGAVQSCDNKENILTIKVPKNTLSSQINDMAHVGAGWYKVGGNVEIFTKPLGNILKKFEPGDIFYWDSNVNLHFGIRGVVSSLHHPESPNVPPVMKDNQWKLSIDPPNSVIIPHRTLDVLGEGGDGEVCSVAVSGSTKIGELVLRDGKRLARKKCLRVNHAEAKILYEMSRHRNSLSFLGWENIENDVYLFTELATGGDLFDYIGTMPQKRLCVEDTLQVAREVVEGLHFLHSKYFVHRDVKPENLLLMKRGCLEHIVISDYGISSPCPRVLVDNDEKSETVGNFYPSSHLSTICGTIDYMAPEMFRRIYGKQADVWSLGCIMYEALRCNPPFHSNDELTRLKKMVHVFKNGILCERNIRGVVTGYDEVDTLLKRIFVPDRERVTTGELRKLLRKK